MESPWLALTHETNKQNEYFQNKERLDKTPYNPANVIYTTDR